MKYLKKYKLFEKSFIDFEEGFKELLSKIKSDLDTNLVELNDINIEYDIQDYIDDGGCEITIEIGNPSSFLTLIDSLETWSKVKYEVFRTISIVEEHGLIFNFLRIISFQSEEKDYYGIEEVKEIDDNTKFNLIHVVFYKENDLY
jgi:hypothetical protein